MASITLSEYGKFVSLQNNSGSADAAAPEGGVYLFASGAIGSARLYLQNEGGVITDLAKAVDIDAFDELDAAPHATQDEFLVSDNGTEKRVSMTNLALGVFAVASDSGDVSYGSDGELTIAADAVESGMLNDNVISGQTELASDGLAAADELMISDGGTLKKIGVDNLMKDGPGLLSAAAVAVADDHFMFLDGGATGDAKVESVADLMTAVAGDGLAASSGVLAVGVDDSSIELNSDALRVKAQGITNAMLADDAVGADELAANAVVNASVDASAGIVATKLNFNVDLGGNVTFGNQADDTVTFTGHVNVAQQLTASHAKITNLDVVTLNSIAQTETTLEIEDKLIVSALSASSANSDGGGLKIGGGQDSAGNASILYDHNSGTPQLDFNIGGTTQVKLRDGAFMPETDNDVDLGASGTEFKDLYLDGTANIDSLKMPDVTSGKILVADGTSYEEVAISGDVSIDSSGAVTIANDAVESGMLNDNVISGQTELASDALNAADEMMISDGGTLKKIGCDNLFKDGPGLLSAAAVDVTTDHIMFLDGGATGDAKIESINDLATAMAGNGLSAGSGAFAVAVDDSSIEINSDALRVKAQGITNAMLADDAVGADELAANAVVNASVASNAAIAATKVNFSVDLGGSILFGTQADDTVAFTGPIKAGGNTIADSGNNAAITLDGSGGMSTLGGFGGGSGISFASSGGAQFATAVTVNKSDGSMSNDFKVFGDTAGAHFMYDASADKGLYHNGTAQVLELGTSANGFAIEVANLAGDAGKIKATAFVTYSDESLKEEVTAMDNALNAVMNLNGVEFTWKNSGQRDFGFLAQEVKNVIPQAVSVGNDGIHGVDYSRLTSVLVEAVKAQQVQIEELKALLKK